MSDWRKMILGRHQWCCQALGPWRRVRRRCCVKNKDLLIVTPFNRYKFFGPETYSQAGMGMLAKPALTIGLHSIQLHSTLRPTCCMEGDYRLKKPKQIARDCLVNSADW